MEKASIYMFIELLQKHLYQTQIIFHKSTIRTNANQTIIATTLNGAQAHTIISMEL